MGIDPKYANLPGIDLNSPDCFETSDVAEPTPDKERGEQFLDDNIQKTNINLKDAHGNFKNKRLDGRSIDFSQRISASRRTGYESLTEYEMHAYGDAEETLGQRLQRLHIELEQCAEELKKQQTEGKQSDALTPLTADLDSAQRVMKQLQLASVLGIDRPDELATLDADHTLHRRMLAHVEEAKKTTSQPSDESVDKANVFELRYLPSGGGGAADSSLSTSGLEQRLASLERTVGSERELASLATALAPHLGDDAAAGASSTVADAVRCLTARVKLLDPRYLEQVETRLSALNHQLVAMADKKPLLENKEQQAKVREAHDLMTKWDAVADKVPGLLARLRELGALHEQALQFSQAVSQLDASQQEITTRLASDRSLLTTVQGQMAVNMETLQSSCQSLEARIEAVTKVKK